MSVIEHQARISKQNSRLVLDLHFVHMLWKTLVDNCGLNVVNSELALRNIHG